MNAAIQPAEDSRDDARRDSARLVMLDVARLIAAIGVIAAHIIGEFYPKNAAWVFGSYAVPFYLFVALYFTARGLGNDPRRSVGHYLLGRLKKLYLPFLVWNVIYDVFHVVRHPHDTFTSPLLLGWAAVYTHLYFLPLLLLSTVLFAPFVRPLLCRGPAMGLAIALLSLTGLIIACSPQPVWLADPLNIAHETLWNFYRATPSALLAMCAALIAVRARHVPRVSSLFALAGAILTIGCLAIEYRIGQQGLLSAGSGLGLAMIGFSTFHARWLTPLAWAGRLSVGVYLSHMLVIRLTMAVVDRYEWPHDGRMAIVVGAIAFIGGLALSAALASSPATRWMIGCETGSSKRTLKANACAMPDAGHVTA